MAIRFTSAALMLALLSGALLAQDVYTGYPMERVRLVRPEIKPPEDVYPQNRVIIRNTNLALVQNGMQVSGEVWTDFEADRVPPGTDLPKGQLTGLRVAIELLYYDTVLMRDPKTEAVLEPKLDPKDPGRLVEGQHMSVTVTQTEGNFGLVRFSLPVLQKPLAPGVYRLVARVRFKSQESKLQQSIKWCSDWYGARGVEDNDTNEMFWTEVMADPELHEEVYRELMDITGEVNDTSLLWIGEIYKDGNLELIAPAQGTDRKPANYMVWSYHMLVVDQLIKYEYELDNVDQVVDAELEQKLKAETRKDAKPEEIKRLEELKEEWKKQAAETKSRVRRENTALIEQFKGRTSKAEVKLHTSSVAARMAILQQIAKLHDYLTFRYWSMLDGHLLYTGYHSINAPAYQAWEAIEKKDNRAASLARKQKLAEVDAAPGGRKAKWDTRAEQWKYFPPEAMKAAFDYLRTKEEQDKFDAEKFTEKDGDAIILDVAKWAEYRTDFIVKWIELTDQLLADVDTSSVYAVQIWPQAYAQAKSARDDVIVLTYAWEYYIRTEQMEEDKKVVMESWVREGESMPTLKLSNYYGRGNNAPGSIKTRFDGSLSIVRSQARIGDFGAAYRRALDKGIEPKFLPGQRPPSAPTKPK